MRLPKDWKALNDAAAVRRNLSMEPSVTGRRYAGARPAGT